MFNRRSLLKASGAGLLAAGLPVPYKAAANPLTSGKLKFLFVFAGGGWDTTRVFASEFSNRNVDMESDAERASAGDLRGVSHWSRPSVDAFMRAYANEIAIVNGMMVRSISHEICTLIAMTGTTASGAPDWPAILGANKQAEYIIPHIVLSGPSFPGDLGVAVARTGGAGQLDALISGDVFTNLDVPVAGPNPAAEAVMDRYLARRVEAKALGARSPAEIRLTADLNRSFDQARRLKEMQYLLSLSASGDLASQGAIAIEALSMGVSRCATIAHYGSQTGWDTHADNDAQQTVLWEQLFSGLTQIMLTLEATPGEEAATLAEETAVVVLSEMGRTPQLNGFNGKDHWPYTSAMVIAPGVRGGQVYGAFDDQFYGVPVDTASAETDEDNGQILSAEALGATLLALADIDPNEHMQGVDPLMGMLL